MANELSSGSALRAQGLGHVVKALHHLLLDCVHLDTESATGVFSNTAQIAVESVEYLAELVGTNV
eukprot:scaffold201992_cov35-Tisochrysis_lutea.AAC.2